MTDFLNAKRLSLREVARRLDLSISTPVRWALNGVRSRKLRTHLYGGRRYCLLADLEDFLAGNGPPAEARHPENATKAGAALTARGV